MSGALAPQLEIAHQGGVEEHHGFGGEGAVLGRAEGQHVDAGAPGDVARVAAEEGDRVGEARAVHLHLEAARVRQLAQARDSGRPVDGTELGRLGERERRGLHAVQADVDGRVICECLRERLQA